MHPAPFTRPVREPRGKTRDLANSHMDSTIWNRLPTRPDDIVVATYAKSGTTWVQQIVAQLVFGGRPDVATGHLSPWVEMVLPGEAETFAMLAAQEHRRILKTHLPADALALRPGLRYIWVARDGRDVAWSLFSHLRRMAPEFYAMLNARPGRVGPELHRPGPDPVAFFRDWLARDGFPLWSFWDNVRTWHALRDHPQVLVLHFDELRANLPAAIRRIAGFLGIAPDPAAFPRIVTQCGFDWMKANARLCAPLGGLPWEGGGRDFFQAGTNGRWRDLLSREDALRYEARALLELGPACADWLARGDRRLSAGPARTSAVAASPA